MGRGAGSGRDRITHLDHTLPEFKTRGQLLQSKHIEGACIATRLRLHSQSRLARPLGLPLQAAAARRRRRDTPPPRRRTDNGRERKPKGRCRARKAS